MRNLTITLGLVVFALAGFYAGARYELNKPAPAASVTAGAAIGLGDSAAAAGGRGAGGTGAGPGAGVTTGGGAGGAGGAGAAFGRGTFGQIVSISGDVLTIQDAQGNQVKVQLSGTTTITKTVGGARPDLVNGTTVTVQGQRGSDGTVAATGITIVPAAALSPRG